MNWFGFTKPPRKKSRWDSPEHILLSFIWGVLFLFLLSGVRGRWLMDAYREGDLSLITNERKRLWVSWAWFDTELGHAMNQFLSLVDIYQRNERDTTADQRLIQVLRFLKHEGSQRKQSIPEAYQWIFDLFIQASEFEEDIVSLLWFTSPQTYLVILQNTAESRPNGGFFGSFAVAKVFQGKIVDMQIRDSYILDYEQKWVSVLWPERLLQYLPHRDVHFVWANKTWFTYIDGNNIKTLYEKVYPWEAIRWVVFLRTDTFEQLIPWFTQQQRERQFTNAATDLIRGTDGFGKKDLYVGQVTDIIANNKSALLRWLIQKLPALIEQGAINIYPSNVSVSWGRFGGGLEWRLREAHLTTRFEQDTAYIREANTTYNKIDEFVAKDVQVKNSDWDVMIQGELDRVPVAQLPAWEWDIHIKYNLSVPSPYRQAIASYERKYGIQLGDREKHILSLTPLREARGLVHLSTQFEILEVSWDITAWRDFNTPIPTNTAWYMVEITEDGGAADVIIRVKKS